MLLKTEDWYNCITSGVLKYEKPHLRDITEDLFKVTRDLKCLLLYSQDQPLMCILQLCALDSSLGPCTMSVLTHAEKKDRRSNPNKSMSVGHSLSLHTVGFTNLSFNNVLVTFYKVHHDNWIICFNTIVCQSHPYIFFKIPEKLQRVKDHCAARVFSTPHIYIVSNQWGCYTPTTIILLAI